MLREFGEVGDGKADDADKVRSFTHHSWFLAVFFVLPFSHYGSHNAPDSMPKTRSYSSMRDFTYSLRRLLFLPERGS